MTILVRVHDDGDTEIRQVESEPEYDTNQVCHSIEDLVRELKDYGHDEDRINEACLRLSEPDWILV